MRPFCSEPHYNSPCTSLLPVPFFCLSHGTGIKQHRAGGGVSSSHELTPHRVQPAPGIQLLAASTRRCSTTAPLHPTTQKLEKSLTITTQIQKDSYKSVLIPTNQLLLADHFSLTDLAGFKWFRSERSPEVVITLSGSSSNLITPPQGG